MNKCTTYETPGFALLYFVTFYIWIRILDFKSFKKLNVRGFFWYLVFETLLKFYSIFFALPDIISKINYC